MTRHSSFLFLIVLLLEGCGSAPTVPLQINGFHIRSESPDALALWYVQNLGLEDTQAQIEVVRLENKAAFISISQSKANLDEKEVKKSSGFFKIGFKTNQLDQLYARLLANGSSFRGGIFYDTNLKTRSLVALDTDGNRVQFFEDTTTEELKPYFFSLMAIDFEQAKAWCESTFGFTEAYNLDLPEKGLSIRLMQKDDVLLELISDQSIQTANEILTGIESIAINGSRYNNREGNLIYTPQPDQELLD